MSGGTATHILNLYTWWRCVVSFTPRPLYPCEKSRRYPFDRRLGVPQSQSGHGCNEKKFFQCPCLESDLGLSSDCGSHICYYDHMSCNRLLKCPLKTETCEWENIITRRWTVAAVPVTAQVSPACLPRPFNRHLSKSLKALCDLQCWFSDYDRCTIVIR